MADWVKIAVRVGTLVLIAGLVITLLSVIQVPATDFSQIATALAVPRAIMVHFMGGWGSVLWNLATAMLSFEITFIGVKIGMIAYRWIMKATA